tara:strand:- start:130 stop:381 length:252 start_codon:yes stop_codon:yes gene_type:complete
MIISAKAILSRAALSLNCLLYDKEFVVDSGNKKTKTQCTKASTILFHSIKIGITRKYFDNYNKFDVLQRLTQESTQLEWDNQY